MINTQIVANVQGAIWTGFSLQLTVCCMPQFQVSVQWMQSTEYHRSFREKFVQKGGAKKPAWTICRWIATVQKKGWHVRTRSLPLLSWRRQELGINWSSPEMGEFLHARMDRVIVFQDSEAAFNQFCVWSCLIFLGFQATWFL